VVSREWNLAGGELSTYLGPVSASISLVVRGAAAVDRSAATGPAPILASVLADSDIGLLSSPFTPALLPKHDALLSS
jgi:hypothetical protein